MSSADPIVRAYRSGDREPVIRLLADSDPWRQLGYGEEDWSRLFRTDGVIEGREGYVLETGGAIVGVALLRPRFLMGDYLELLAVADKARRQGLGALLLAQIESVTFSRATNLFACVSDFNNGARRFYARQGYREIGPIPNLLVPGSAELLLRKTSGPARGK